jgi:transposase
VHAPPNLPDDVESLKQLIVEQRTLLLSRQIEIDKLKVQLARLRRLHFGRSSEQLAHSIAQLELSLEELETSETMLSYPARSRAPAEPSQVPLRRALPRHLPREEIVHTPSCICAQCGGELRRLGEEVSEILERVPAQFKVVRHVRVKLSCARCQSIVQAPAPARPIERGLPGPGLLAYVLISKYADHLPLYRQSQIYAREGVDLDRSTLADWVGRAAFLLRPVHERLLAGLKRSPKLFADETTAPVLDPGRGRTKTGQLWAYARDDRPWGGADPPAVTYVYAPDRKAERPIAHLAGFTGILQVDGYVGYRSLAERGDVQLAFCWAHVRRRFYELAVAGPAPIASEALERIAGLYAIEGEIRGRSAAARRRADR